MENQFYYNFQIPQHTLLHMNTNKSKRYVLQLISFVLSLIDVKGHVNPLELMEVMNRSAKTSEMMDILLSIKCLFQEASMERNHFSSTMYTAGYQHGYYDCHMNVQQPYQPMEEQSMENVEQVVELSEETTTTTPTTTTPTTTTPTTTTPTTTITNPVETIEIIENVEHVEPQTMKTINIETIMQNNNQNNNINDENNQNNDETNQNNDEKETFNQDSFIQSWMEKRKKRNKKARNMETKKPEKKDKLLDNFTLGESVFQQNQTIIKNMIDSILTSIIEMEKARLVLELEKQNEKQNEKQSEKQQNESDEIIAMTPKKKKIFKQKKQQKKQKSRKFTFEQIQNVNSIHQLEKMLKMTENDDDVMEILEIMEDLKLNLQFSKMNEICNSEKSSLSLSKIDGEDNISSDFTPIIMEEIVVPQSKEITNENETNFLKLHLADNIIQTVKTHQQLNKVFVENHSANDLNGTIQLLENKNPEQLSSSRKKPTKEMVDAFAKITKTHHMGFLALSKENALEPSSSKVKKSDLGMIFQLDETFVFYNIEISEERKQMKKPCSFESFDEMYEHTKNYFKIHQPDKDFETSLFSVLKLLKHLEFQFQPELMAMIQYDLEEVMRDDLCQDDMDKNDHRLIDLFTRIFAHGFWGFIFSARVIGCSIHEKVHTLYAMENSDDMYEKQVFDRLSQPFELEGLDYNPTMSCLQICSNIYALIALNNFHDAGKLAWAAVKNNVFTNVFSKECQFYILENILDNIPLATYFQTMILLETLVISVANVIDRFYVCLHGIEVLHSPMVSTIQEWNQHTAPFSCMAWDNETFANIMKVKIAQIGKSMKKMNSNQEKVNDIISELKIIPESYLVVKSLGNLIMTDMKNNGNPWKMYDLVWVHEISLFLALEKTVSKMSSEDFIDDVVSKHHHETFEKNDYFTLVTRIIANNYSVEPQFSVTFYGEKFLAFMKNIMNLGKYLLPPNHLIVGQMKHHFFDLLSKMVKVFVDYHRLDSRTKFDFYDI